ncbi:hypothetical protein [Cypionkella sp.]|uniref:hypothetical protein n=1 Tax=Cypionkella sp. TaxID=2811411 RepID=UPI00261B9BE1|nr:hypothetical protein [Cypionkella sp.]MDB5663550.1 hypothetical protein [Cypionkella sp.]
MMHLDRTSDTLQAADKLAGMARAAPDTLLEAGFAETDRFPLNRAALALRRGRASESDYRLLLEVAGLHHG